MPSINRSKTLNQERKTLTAIDQYLSTAGTLTLNGTDYTPATLKSLIQSDVNAADKAVTAKSSFHVATQDAHDIHLQVAPVLHALKAFLTLKYGSGAAGLKVLRDFGYPVKEPKVKLATKNLAAAKNKATRTARHTMGKTEKKAVKGSVAAPAAPAPSGDATPTASSGTTPKPAGGSQQ
jgi:hypothetical protein